MNGVCINNSSTLGVIGVVLGARLDHEGSQEMENGNSWPEIRLAHMDTGSPNGYTISVVTTGWLSNRSCSLGQELRNELLYIKIGQTVTKLWLKTANSN